MRAWNHLGCGKEQRQRFLPATVSSWGNGGRKLKLADQPRLIKKLTALKEAVFSTPGNSDPHDPPDIGCRMQLFVDESFLFYAQRSFWDSWITRLSAQE